MADGWCTCGERVKLLIEPPDKIHETSPCPDSLSMVAVDFG